MAGQPLLPWIKGLPYSKASVAFGLVTVLRPGQRRQRNPRLGTRVTPVALVPSLYLLASNRKTPR